MTISGVVIPITTSPTLIFFNMSCLAIEFAEESGQTLIGFLRGQSLSVYAHPQRIT